MATSKDQYASIVRMLQSGKFTQAEIAEEIGVSKRTVTTIQAKIKEKVLNASEEAIEDFIKSSYKDYITKDEKKYIVHYKNILDYEDSEEGWTFHIEDLKEYKRQSGCWFSAIAYPESVNPNWISLLEATGMEIAISPLHDKDVWNHDSPAVVDEETGEIIEEAGTRYKCGDKKKSHWHILIKSQRRIQLSEMNSLIRKITNGPYVIKCNSISGMFNYLTHELNPEKYHYEKDEIIKLNNFLIEFNKAEQKMILNEICEYLVEHTEIDSLSKCIRAYKGNYEYMMIIAAKAYAITQICNDNWRHNNPDGRIKNVRIVK